jgi:hypothetical protein
MVSDQDLDIFHVDRHGIPSNRRPVMASRMQAIAPRPPT